MQEATVTDWFGQQATNVEHWQQHGFSMVPLPPDKDGQAEALIAYLGGSADHPVIIGVADRRHRPKDGKPGDIRIFDHRKQSTVLSKDGMTHTTPMKITHNTVDKDGKVMSSVVQHPDGKVEISNAKGAMAVLDGPNIKFKAGSGGSHAFDGPVNVKGAVTSNESFKAPTLSGNLTA